MPWHIFESVCMYMDNWTVNAIYAIKFPVGAYVWILTRLSRDYTGKERKLSRFWL